MAREYFCAYHSYRAWMEMLTDAEKGRLFDALLAYSETGELLSLGGREAALFPAMKWNIDRDKKAYEERCETNRKNGANGSNRTRTPPNATERPPIAPQIKGKGEREGKGKLESSPPVSPSPGERTKKKFVPPTLEEVAQYCRERNSSVDPKKFWEYFSTPDSQGRTWIDSEGKPVRNWKQKLLTWEKFNPGKQQGKPTAQSMGDETMKYVRDLYKRRKEES